MGRIAVRFGRWKLLSAVPALSGYTTLGPDYQEPDVAWLHDWQPDLNGQIADSEQ